MDKQIGGVILWKIVKDIKKGKKEKEGKKGY